MPSSHTAWSRTSRFTIHTLIVGDIARSVLSEMAQIVDKLNHNIAAYCAIQGITSKTRACRATESRILIEDIIHANQHLASTIFEHLLAKVEITKQEVLVVVVRKA